MSPDREQPKIGRAKALRPDALLDYRSFDQHWCQVHDCSALDRFVPNIDQHGFTHADLSALGELQAILTRVRVAGEVRDEDASRIRRLLTGVSVPLAGGRRLRLLFIASEGLLMRKAGPNGLSVNSRATNAGMNDHDAAMAVHADQDVTGTPVKQILRGVAPWLFHHDSPGRSNSISPVFLLNIWIPLQQLTRPLALMDHRTLDRQRHQLRYGLPTDAFLDREADRRVNDIWTFLHDSQQQWYFTSNLDANTAYVFNTLGTPHGAFVLPGEARAEALYLAIRAARAAVEGGDEEALRRATLDVGDDVRAHVRAPGLAQAIDDMEAVVLEARTHASALSRGEGAADWSARAGRLADRVVRKSLEMRAIGVVTPEGWPLGRRNRRPSTSSSMG